MSIVASLAMLFVLVWIYEKLEERRAPFLEEERLQNQEKQETESAKRALTDFLDAWQNGDAELAQQFLSENAVVQAEHGVFALEERFASYRIISVEKIAANEFRAHIERQTEKRLPAQIEIVGILKLLDFYSIDSLEPAG